MKGIKCEKCGSTDGFIGTVNIGDVFGENSCNFSMLMQPFDLKCMSCGHMIKEDKRKEPIDD